MTICVLGTDVVIAALDRADTHHPAAREAFAIATAEWLEADLASFDRRVRRALEEVGPRLSPALSD